MDTILHIYIHTVHTFTHTYTNHTYIHAYMHTYIHTYIHLLQSVELDASSAATLGRGFSCGVSNMGVSEFSDSGLIVICYLYVYAMYVCMYVHLSAVILGLIILPRPSARIISILCM